MDKSNERSLCYLILLTLNGSILCFIQECIPEPLETIFFMDGTKNVDAGERELMNQLATNIASSLPDQSTVGVYSLDYQAKEIESFTKTSHGHSWSIIVPIRNEMKRYGNYISMKALDNEIKARYPAKRYSPKAEIFILFVSDESKLDDVVPLFLAKKKTFVVVFGSYIPSIYKSIASRKDHLYLVRKKEEVSYVSFSIIKRIKCDSRFNCDTDKYSLQKGAGCKSCFYICGAKLGDLTIVCKTRCPYLRLSTKSSHEDFVEEAALKSHKEDNKEALKSHEEDNTSLHAIIILCRYMFIACGVYCCYRCPRGCKRYLRSRLARLKRLKNKAFRTLDVEGWNTLTLSYPITSIETAHVYIREDDWGSCLQSKDESKIKELLQENIIPNSNHLNDAYRIFEPSSEILEGIFALASEHIKNQSSHILRVYAAYHDRMISDSSYCFLVFTKQSAAIQVHLNVKNVEYPIKIVYIEDCSQEGEDVVEASLKRYSQLVYVGQVEISISEHSERLMKETKNITLITTSMYKSRNYQRGKPLNLVEGPCIVILVMLKNWIPIGSKPLPKKINGISVDVREGIAVQFTGKLPTEKHENVRIGCKIESSVFPGSGNSLDVYNQGTLGGFILDKNSSIYGFTCAHILFPDEVLRQMQNDDQLYVGNDLGLTVEKMPGEMISNLNKIVNCPDKRKVYQASCEENEYLGTVEMALYARGGTFDFTGVDFAVVKIDEKRIPNTTKFPYFDDSITFNREMEGASAEREFHFKSGKVIEEDLKSGEKVIKYGCKTQLTEGYFQRKCTFNFIDGEKWHGQCEIIAQRGFAKPSDSGSLVFKPKDGDLEAACILLGGTTTRFAATHFADVLERTGLKDVKFLKFGDPKANEDSM